MASRSNVHAAEVSDDWYSDLWRKIYRVLVGLLFVWACLWLQMMWIVYSMAIGQDNSPSRWGEWAAAVAIVSCYGLPAWIGIPLLSGATRGRLSKPVRYLAYSPIVLAATLIIAMMVVGV